MSGEDSTYATTTPAAPDPLFIDLVQRVSKLEERSVGLEKLMGALKDDVGALKGRVESLEGKVWYIVVGIGVSILLQILLRLMP
jgi:hypothetical protein